MRTDAPKADQTGERAARAAWRNCRKTTVSEENKGGVPSPAELVEERGLTKGEYGAIATGPDKKPELRRESSLLGCWLVRSCRSTTLSTVVEVGMNPANQFGNLSDSGFGHMQAAQSCGNRRSLSEGSEILKLDGYESRLSPTCGSGSCWLLLDRSCRSTTLSTVEHA